MLPGHEDQEQLMVKRVPGQEYQEQLRTQWRAVRPLEREMGGEGMASTIQNQLASSQFHRQLLSSEEINPQDGHLDLSLYKGPLEVLAQ